MREILSRRTQEVGAEEPASQDFRRTFTLAVLRNDTDIYTFAKLMGHEGITVLHRYLKQTNIDTEEAHRQVDPWTSRHAKQLIQPA